MCWGLKLIGLRVIESSKDKDEGLQGADGVRVRGYRELMGLVLEEADMVRG